MPIKVPRDRDGLSRVSRPDTGKPRRITLITDIRPTRDEAERRVRALLGQVNMAGAG